MPIGLRPSQLHDQIVDVSEWRDDPDYPVFPEGSQPKRLLTCPEGGDISAPFLLPGHKYLFKVPRGWQVNQIWSELIAYEMSRFIDVQVPPAFLAIDRQREEVGVLVEFFYGYADEPRQRFVPGSDFLHAARAGAYDRKRGRPHPFRANLGITRALGLDGYREWWSNTLVFDALIGNGDRHPDNWGVLMRPVPGGVEHLFAPLFDNGSGLAYNLAEQKLTDPASLVASLNRGKHHCSWAREDKGSPHFEMCAEILTQHKEASLPSQLLIRYDEQTVGHIIDWCRGFDIEIELSSERGEFLKSFLLARREKLLQIG